jgi:hypothetical protein
MNYKMVPISNKIAEQIRTTMTSPFGGLPAWSSVANGYGPCRSCLQFFRQGEEERIFITYDPFSEVSDLPLPGPVFIHADACEEYPGDVFPAHLLSIPMIFEGYGKGSRLTLSEQVDSERLDKQITEMLSKPEVEFIHLRNAEAGCSIARIERMVRMGK